MRDCKTFHSRRLCTAVSVFILLFSSPLHSQDWQRVGVDYHGTDIAPGGRRIFVGDYGGILLSQDNGTTWSLPYSGTWSHLRAVRFPDARNGIAAGEDGVLLRTTDGGQTWSTVASPVRSTIHAVDFPVATIGYGLADSGVMIRTTDGGGTWDVRPNRLPGIGTGLRFINEERGVVITAEGIIYRTEKSGDVWTPVFSDTTLTLSGVEFNREGITGYVCSREGAILKTTDAGKTWRAVTPLEPGIIPLSIAISQTGTVYVGGERVLSEDPDQSPFVYVSGDGGATWVRGSVISTGCDTPVFYSISVRDGYLAIAGNCGMALLSGANMEQGGQRLISNSLLNNSDPSRYNLPLYRVAFSGPDTGIATVNAGLGASGAISLRTTNGGISWQANRSDQVQNYLDIFAFPGKEFLAFSDNGGELFRSTDVGKTWLPQGTDPVEPRVITSHVGTLVDRQRGYMAGDSLVYQTTDGGKRWQPRFFSGISGRWSGVSAVTHLSFPTFETGYAVFATGKGDQVRVIVIRTEDGGETWREVLSCNGSPAYYGLHFVNGGRGFYCEGRPWENTGVLFSTTDGGQTWDSLVFDDASPFAIKFFDERNGVVLGSPFLLMRTTDGGETWNREYTWPPEVDTTGGLFTDAVLLPDERTVVLIGIGAIARKTYPDRLVSVADERRDEQRTETFSVVPNPARDRLRVVLRSSMIGEGTGVRFYDLLGRDMLGNVVPLGSSGVAEIDVSNLPAGAYRAVVEGKEGDVIAVRSVMVVR